MARRAWVVHELEAEYPETPFLLLDSGNFSDNPTRAGERKTTFLLQAMENLGYGAVNVGERDLQSGFERMEQRTKECAIPFLSANIIRRDTQQPVFPPYTVVQAKAQKGDHALAVGVVGVARFNPIFRKPGPDGAELEIIPPREPVSRAVKALRAKGVSLVILLASMHADDVDRLLDEVPGIDFVVGSYGGTVLTRKHEGSNTWVLYAGNQGKRFGETRVYLDKDAAGREPVIHMHYLNDAYPGDPTMMEFLNNLPPDPEVGGGPADPTRPFVGSTRCRDCHAAVYAQWASTPHATAYATLDREGKSGSAECVTCHVTAAGKQGGFISFRQTPGMAQVGCEACHGPGRPHIAETASPYGKISVSTCTGCHDVKNSPEFDYYSYRDRVLHHARDRR